MKCIESSQALDLFLAAAPGVALHRHLGLGDFINDLDGDGFAIRFRPRAFRAELRTPGPLPLQITHGVLEGPLRQ